MAANTYVRDWDDGAKKVIGFLVGKGLLRVPDVKPLPSVKIDILEAIRVGTEVEPRVLEVLPAAMLRFPRSFLQWDRVPEKLQLVLDCIKKNMNSGPDLAGLRYKDLKRWANYQLPDKRTLPVKDRRVKKSWRLKPAIIKEIRKRAKMHNITETEVIEKFFDTQ